MGYGEWGMGNGEWKEDEEWNGEWGMRNEWIMGMRNGNEEWGMGNGKMGMGNKE